MIRNLRGDFHETLFVSWLEIFPNLRALFLGKQDGNFAIKSGRTKKKSDVLDSNQWSLGLRPNAVTSCANTTSYYSITIESSSTKSGDFDYSKLLQLLAREPIFLPVRISKPLPEILGKSPGKKERNVPELNQWPTDLQSVALPLS